MSIDFRIITVGFSEPTLWVSVVIVAILAIAAGAFTGARVARRPPGITQWASGVWLGFLLAVVFIVIAHLLFSLLYSAATGGAIVCTYVVGPVLLLPAALALVSEATVWWATAKRLHHAV